MVGIQTEVSEMKTYPDVSELYRRREAARKTEAKRPIAEKLAVLEQLREIHEKLAPFREAHKAKVRAARAMKKIG